MNRLSLVTALGVALGVSCSDPTSTSPTQLNLDRPVDIAFACYGGMRVTNGRATGDIADPIKTTAQPVTSCETRSQPHEVTEAEHRPPGQDELPGAPAVGAAYWFGFILESAAGTVAIAQWPSAPPEDFAGGLAGVSVLDADPLTPGKNAISVGEDPIAIATDKSGCYEVTANAGSCDLSELEINSALDENPAVNVTRVAVQNKAGTETIRAKPAAMVAEPNMDVVGNECAATATGVVYVAYPSCHLVAAVDMSPDPMAAPGAPRTGRIVSALQYDAAGVPSLLSGTALDNLPCQPECPDDKGALGSITPGTRPVTLALELDPRVKTKRLVIGAENSASFTIVELGADSLPLSLSQIALQDPTGELGITSIALSPQLGLGGTGGVINDDTANQAQYVYAVATDNTVRVADVLNLNRECDTQIDSRFVRSLKDLSELQCLPLGDPTLPRRAGAKGPGIELVGDGVPTSVAFFKAPVPNTGVSPDPAPTALVGYFAIITASSGASFVVNVDDDNNEADLFQLEKPQSTAPTLTIAHQLRDNILDPGAVTATDPDMKSTLHSCLDPGASPVAGGANTGGPRATSPPARNVAGGPVADTKVPELPSLRQVSCTGYDTPQDPSFPNDNDKHLPVPVSEVQFAADLQTRDHVFPDLRSLASDETWTLSWEGPLSQDTNATAVDGPVIRKGVMTIDPGNGSMRLFEQTHPFCAMGTELFDIVQLRGCNPANGDTDCPAGYQCYLHPDSQVATGSCMLATEASRLANACHDFLTSLRRYTVGLAKSGELVLLPRKHELRTTPIDGCTTDAQCEALADYAVQTSSAADPVQAQTASDPHTWACRTDDARAPVNTDPVQNKRCVETCLQNSDCDVGTICQGVAMTGTGTTPGVCMEGVTPPQACVNGPQRFDVRASEAFTVIGSRSGYIHSIIDHGPDSNPLHDHECVRDPAASSLQIGRIPLQAPACDPAADPITGKTSGGFEANPCSLTTPEVENQPVYPDLASGSCALGKPEVVFATRGAPAIQFRNPGLKLTLVDPTYPGDQTCILDRQGALGRVPLVFPGYQLSFHQTAGYAPLALGIDPAFPVKVVHGPTDSIWVLDDGDFLSTSIGQASTRGKVFRIESIDLGAIHLLQ